jgi:hypothetical protein
MFSYGLDPGELIRTGPQVRHMGNLNHPLLKETQPTEYKKKEIVNKEHN